MSEQGGRDWVRMTPDDFDREAPPRPEVDGRIPAELDECGTAPLFGDEPPPARTGRTTARTLQRARQERLF
ncbi:hypothetical protein ACFW2V_01300 [Streptomyces sp. NPDC058947]|uniref:Uncharacterized protein n=1 Tax=Streptomyces levis TaxID=285566 RepID=A0ABN3P1D5_9ACTN|nr:hypothetical protein [Streptomyces sp. XY006]